MARVTDAEVKEIIETTLTTTPFITIANLIVTDKLGSSTLSADLLKEIERWLAAHFVAIRDPREIRSKISQSEAWFAPNVTTAWGMGLRFTPYGQQVLVLDSTGTLAKLGEKQAVFRVSPDPPDDEE